MISNDNIDDEKITNNINIIYKDLNVNKSLTDQILSLNIKHLNDNSRHTNSNTCGQKVLMSKRRNGNEDDKYLQEKIKSIKSVVKKEKIIDIPLVLSVPSKATHAAPVHMYLENLGASSVPFDLFDHVISSLKNYLKLNIKVEYLYDAENSFYWFAIIKQTYGNLLHLKFLVPKLNHNHNNSNNNSTSSSSSSSSSSNTEVIDEVKKNGHLETKVELLSENDDEMDDDDDDETIVMDSEDDRGKLYFFYLLNHEKQERIKPVGWCRKHGQTIKMPDFIYEKLKLKYSQQQQYKDKIIEKINSKVSNLMISNVNTTLLSCFFDSLTDKAAHTAPNLTTKCISQLRVNQILELQDFNMPLNIWFVRIVENIGGRLLLEYYFDSDFKSEKFWLFYLDTHLHHVGWARHNQYNYRLPMKYENSVNIELENVVDMVLDNPVVLNTVNSSILVIDLFKNQQKFYSHRFQIGHMFEVLYENMFYVAHIVELSNEHYFKVKLHVKEREIYLHFTSTSQNIFPFKWCEQNMLKLQLPHDWPTGKRFSWDDYIRFCNRTNEMEIKDFYIGADQSLFSSITSCHLKNICEKYKIGSYLECVNPNNSNEICVGQIKLRVKHLLFIRIYSRDSADNEDLFSLKIFTQNSFDLFPVGWCEMNNYKNFILPIHFTKEIITSKDVYRTDLNKVPYLARFSG